MPPKICNTHSSQYQHYDDQSSIKQEYAKNIPKEILRIKTDSLSSAKSSAIPKYKTLDEIQQQQKENDNDNDEVSEGRGEGNNLMVEDHGGEDETSTFACCL